MNINLGTQWEAFIDENIKSGRYLSASELVRDGLRLLQEKEQLRQLRMEELREEVKKGLDALDQGEYRELDEQEIPISRSFWESPSLDELAEAQDVKPVNDVNALLGGWPGDPDDGFEEEILRIRRAGVVGD